MKIRNRFLNKCLAHVAAFALRTIVRTCKPEFHEAEPGTNPYEKLTDERFLVSFWHDQIAIYVFIRPHDCMAGLVSQHRDGEYLADGMRAVGVKPIRGSSKRGGAAAIKQMMNDARDYHIAITPDGPRGPEHQMKQGIVYLASRMQRPIIPTYSICESAWRIKGNWTDLIIPKPFSRVIVLGAPRFRVPADLSKEELIVFEEKLQREMDRLKRNAHAMLRGEEIDQHPMPAAA